MCRGKLWTAEVEADYRTAKYDSISRTINPALVKTLANACIKMNLQYATCNEQVVT